MASQQTRDLIQRGEVVYEQRIKAKLAKSPPEYFVAIEPESGDFFLGQTLSDASAAARKVYPDRRTYVRRVGNPIAVHLGGGRV